MADWSIFSDPMGAMSTFHRVIAKSFERNVYGEGYSRDEFRARILSTPILMDESVGANDVGRYKFYARITGRHSPHDELIDDPCDPTYIADRQLAEELIQMHTEFRSKGITEKPEKGDEVIVRLHRRSNGLDGEAYDLTIGEYIKPAIPLEAISSNYGPSSGNTVSAEECAALGDAFAGGVADCPNCKMEEGHTDGQPYIDPGDNVADSQACLDQIEINNKKCGPKANAGCKDSHWKRKANCPETSYNRYAKNIYSINRQYAYPFFNQFLAFIISKGWSWEFTSARRSVKHQWNLYTGRQHTSNIAGMPCESNHQWGMAIDITIRDENGNPIHKRSGLMTQLENEFNQYLGPSTGTGGKIYWLGHSGDHPHWDMHYALDGTDIRKEVSSLKKKCKAYFWDRTTGDPGTGSDIPAEWDSGFTDTLIDNLPEVPPIT